MNKCKVVEGVTRKEAIEAEKRVGTLSEPAKMPCLSWGTPTTYCKTGSKLRQVKGSICSMCYAGKAKQRVTARRKLGLKGGGWSRYQQDFVKNVYEKRYEALVQDKENGYANWINDITTIIKYRCRTGYFRWNDSGDIVDERHLNAIIEVAKRTPNIQHWIATREYKLVKEWMERNTIPANVIIRVSAVFPNVPAPTINNLPKGNVVIGDEEKKEGTVLCGAAKRDGKCEDCRACWDKNLDVDYPLH